MSPKSSVSRSPLLRNRGWRNCVEAQLVRPEDADAPPWRSHAHTLRRLFEDIGANAVLCIEGRPTVCLLDGRQLDDDEVEVVRHRLWNLGATTLLVAERRRQVQVFSTSVRPLPHDSARGALLSDETIGDLRSAELALRLQSLIRRVETGAIYREYAPLFDPQHAVDRFLLDNLKALRNQICPRRSEAEYRRAHALIGKFLFSCYLLDRGVIGPAYLEQAGLPPANNILDLLDRASDRKADTLEKLFATLQHDFNGSLFGGQFDAVLTDAEADELRRFLTEDLRNSQPLLFRLYDFHFIPVELISSIYQDFLSAEAEAEDGPAQPNRTGNRGQREQGTYYTPPRLAELTVDVATQDWDTLLDKRCLDSSCGSGVFLVILFVRMAEEWRRRNPDADTEKRYRELLRLLSENLHGIDRHATACLVACFSLYLAFLDQMEPKDIVELREVLQHDARKLLPRILWERDKHRPRSPHLATIREADSFECKPQREFDLVIGNPPWVSRKSAPSAEAWLFSEDDNPAVRGLKKAERAASLFPNKEQACAFMWKACYHLREGGRVCQVLPSRVFLSNNTDQFQAWWLKHHRLESVWLLADYRFVLFPGADCPCFIGRYRPRRDEEPWGEFEFVTPKVERLDPRESLIPILPEDRKDLHEADMVQAATKSEAASAWKRQHWGTPRDQRLLSRLLAMPKLDAVCARPPRMKRDTPETRVAKDKKRWWKGQGFQPLSEKDRMQAESDPWPIWWKTHNLLLTATTAPHGLTLLESDACEPYGNRPKQVRRTIAPELCRPPLLLINKACTKFLLATFDGIVLFQDDFQSICAPQHEMDELVLLSAFFSSPLAQYLLFHTTANIGIERDIARLEELLQLPFPLPEDTADPHHSQAIVRDCTNAVSKLRQELSQESNLLRRDELTRQTQRHLSELVYDYFRVCAWERDLIEDTVAIFRPSSTPASLDSEALRTASPSQLDDRRQYAETLAACFRNWTQTDETLRVEGCVAQAAGLAFVTLNVGEQAQPYRESAADDQVEQLLERIRESSAETKSASFHILRGFAFFEGEQVHLLKPLNRRHWTRTAAWNDADEVLSLMMREDGWDV